MRKLFGQTNSYEQMVSEVQRTRFTTEEGGDIWNNLTDLEARLENIIQRRSAMVSTYEIAIFGEQEETPQIEKQLRRLRNLVVHRRIIGCLCCFGRSHQV
jgi:hypothetical protein